MSSATSSPSTHFLVLTFPSFSSLASIPKSSYAPHIASSALRSCTSASTHTLLIILIRFNQPDTSPWSSSSSSGPSSSSSSSDSDSTRTRSTPGQAWSTLETLLARCYASATQVLIAQDRLLAGVHVVIEEMRGIQVCLPSGEEGVTRVTIEADPSQEKSGMKNEEEREGWYQVVAMGGTFDHLHAGHKILLTMAASLTTRKLIVGVTDTELLQTKKHHDYLEPMHVRINSTKLFLEWIRPGIEHEVVPIQDPYGPTATEADIQAIVVSEETRSGGEAVNKKRSESDLGQLDVWVIGLMADDAQKGGEKVKAEAKMGSTNIRKWLSERDAKR